MGFFPAYRQAGLTLRMTENKTAQNDRNKMFEMMKGRRNGRRKISKKFSAALLFQLLD